MKLNKTFGRIATTLVATAMLASVAVVPAFATGEPQYEEGEFGTSTIQITKELIMPSEVNVPDVTFSFDILAGDVGENGEDYIDRNGVTLDVIEGTGTNMEAGSVSFDSEDPTTMVNETTKKVTGNFTLSLPTETYSKPGVYKYTIDEENVGADYYDKTQSLNLYLIVARTKEGQDGAPDTYGVVGAVVKNSDDDKTATWTNYYRLDEDGKPDVGSISVTKMIAGAMGDKGDEFEFTIGLPNDGVEYSYKINGVLQEGTLSYTNNKVDLGHNDTLQVLGLNDKETVTVDETIPEGSGYVKSIDEDNDGNLNNGVTLTVDKDEEQVVTFINTRAAVSPTGLVMDIAPYALLVVVAAAGCFVFLRKRRED